MIVLWFIIGILLAFGIARYNESNKLFWQLTLAFTLGYAVTVMCTRTFGGDDNNQNLTQVCSPQESVVVGVLPALFQTAYNMIHVKVTASNPVSQIYTPDTREIEIVMSEVYGRTRDQPQGKPIKPPELCLAKVISTLHDV